jgi:hypothetical protein
MTVNIFVHLLTCILNGCKHHEIMQFWDYVEKIASILVSSTAPVKVYS